MQWTNAGSILITGAGQRIGLYCAQVMAEQGERVAITYRSEHAVIDSLRASGVICLRADFSQQEDIDQLIKDLHANVGPLRAIVHNASSWRRDVGISDNHSEVMQEMVQVHMMAPYLINLHCHDLLVKGAQQWADIIHITDYVIEEGSDNHIAYAASKAGLDGMARSFARLYAPAIKVNSIAPSLVLFNDHDTPEYKEHTINKAPLAIEPGPEVILQGLRYILDNPYMTGRTLQLDGGRHIR